MTEPTCSHCRRPFRGPEGCDGGLPHAHRVGLEANDYTRTLGDRCSDCGAPCLEQHHAGCLHAWCRRCDDQAVFCDPDECAPR